MLHAAHILCLVSSTSAAPTQALHLARHLDATLHVMPHPPSRQLSGSTVDRDELRACLPRCVSDASEGVHLQVSEAPPDSVSAVLQHVADSHIDLVVIDTPPDRGPVPPLAADATRTLIQQLDCPVFVVEHVEDPTAIHDILVPTDLSDHAIRAFKHAVALAPLYDAAVHVLHVVDTLPYVALTPTDRLSLGTTPLSEHRGQRRLRAFLQEGEVPDVPIHAHLAYGDAADQIVHFADRADIDLMMLASHGSGNQPNSPLGTVGKRVLGRATCPLFLVPAFGSAA